MPLLFLLKDYLNPFSAALQTRALFYYIHLNHHHEVALNIVVDDCIWQLLNSGRY